MISAFRPHRCVLGATIFGTVVDYEVRPRRGFERLASLQTFRPGIECRHCTPSHERLSTLEGSLSMAASEYRAGLGHREFHYHVLFPDVLAATMISVIIDYRA